VLVDFWTYTCINWLRTLAYVRAWAQKYEDRGLVVIGVHTPEFPFEHLARLHQPLLAGDLHRRCRRKHPPSAVRRGGYDDCERGIQQLLSEAGVEGVADDLVSVTPEGFEAQADWTNLRSPETYLGHAQGRNFASRNGTQIDVPATHAVPEMLMLNQWALSGDWTIESRASVLNSPEGRIAFRFHARDVHLVMGPPARTTSVPFRVLVDGRPPRRRLRDRRRRGG
jgi:hypothetical protein